MNFTTITLIITENQSGTRLDKVLPCLEEIYSRSQAIKLFESKLVTLNKKPIKPSYICSLGESFEIRIPQRIEISLDPYDFKLDIVHEDEDLLVINKPANIVMHPSLGHENKSIVNALIHRKTSLSMGFNEQRPGIVHRLDKDTSGLVVVAKNNTAHTHLSQQFQARSVKRSYWAIVWGLPRSPSGTIQSQLQRHPKNRKKYASTENENKGKNAITHYSLIKTQLNKLSLIRCQLDTGRTHQIRVHLSELHHPIIGDTLYGNDKRSVSISSALISEIQSMHRIGLHAFELGFFHPTQKKQFYFKIDWPEDLKNIVKLLDFNN